MARDARARVLQLPRPVIRTRQAVAEAAEQEAIERQCAALGLHCYDWSRDTREGHAGRPDLYIADARRGLAWWWEVKAEDGELLPEQARFRAECLATGVRHGYGTSDHFREWVELLGYGRRIGRVGFQAFRSSEWRAPRV